MTLEELQTIFGNAEAIPGVRGAVPYYTYYLPLGTGMVAADKLADILPTLEGMALHGYTDDRCPIFSIPKAE